jgi:hypothetical protein
VQVIDALHHDAHAAAASTPGNVEGGLVRAWVWLRASHRFFYPDKDGSAPARTVPTESCCWDRRFLELSHSNLNIFEADPQGSEDPLAASGGAAGAHQSSNSVDHLMEAAAAGGGPGQGHSRGPSAVLHAKAAAGQAGRLLVRVALAAAPACRVQRSPHMGRLMRHLLDMSPDLALPSELGRWPGEKALGNAVSLVSAQPGAVFHLACNTHAERDMWLNALTNAILREASAGPPSASLASVGQGATERVLRRCADIRDVYFDANIEPCAFPPPDDGAAAPAAAAPAVASGDAAGDAGSLPPPPLPAAVPFDTALFASATGILLEQRREWAYVVEVAAKSAGALAGVSANCVLHAVAGVGVCHQVGQ